MVFNLYKYEDVIPSALEKVQLVESLFYVCKMADNMAILQSEHFSIEFIYTGFEQYHLFIKESSIIKGTTYDIRT